jgi:RNA 2',3'-cyclic 3'-phosphodiesterase
MTKKRLFIAINLPENVKDSIEKELEKIKYDFTDDVRFVDRENWHITVAFLGDQEDEAILPILESMKEAAARFGPLKVELADLSYGPPGRPPRMIWLNGNAQSAAGLGEVKDALESNLADNGVTFKSDYKKFSLHITLARLFSANQLPYIGRKLQISFEAKSLDLMESALSPSGAKYENLQQVHFRLK